MNREQTLHQLIELGLHGMAEGSEAIINFQLTKQSRRSHDAGTTGRNRNTTTRKQAPGVVPKIGKSWIWMSTLEGCYVQS